MYNGELHCRTVFSFLFVELRWSLFYELDFLLLVSLLCVAIHFSASCSYIMQRAFSLPRYDNGIHLWGTPNKIMEDTMP